MLFKTASDNEMKVQTVRVKKSDTNMSKDRQKQTGVVLVSPVSCSQTLEVITQRIMMEHTHCSGGSDGDPQSAAEN